jgi:signal transduction histidine kinase
MGLRRLTRLATRLSPQRQTAQPRTAQPGTTQRGIARRRTARRRLTVLYVMMFLVSGVLLLGITGAFSAQSSAVRSVGSPQQPPQSALTQADAQIQQLQTQLANETSQAHAQADHQLLVGSLIALGVMLVLSVILGLVVAGRVLRPLREMTDTTRRISADNLNQRLDMQGPRDELKDLADTIDALLERLEQAFAAQRRFVANASHELRTPLTTMRASLDVAVAKPEPVPEQTLALAGRLRTELDQVDRLLDGFLVLARAQHGVLPGRQILTLDGIVSAALAARADAIAARHLVVQHTEAPAGAWVDGSQPLLSRMVANVIDNAIGHNADGGWIHIMTGTGNTRPTGTGNTRPTGTGHTRLNGTGRTRPHGIGPIRATLAVETGGPVLDQDQVDQLAQPFRRLGTDRIGTDRTSSDGGAGLGLSIVAAIAAAHDGALHLTARPEGGLRVVIELPQAQPAPAGAMA